jgi:hypothetical protein
VCLTVGELKQILKQYPDTMRVMQPWVDTEDGVIHRGLQRVFGASLASEYLPSEGYGDEYDDRLVIL